MRPKNMPLFSGVFCLLFRRVQFFALASLILALPGVVSAQYSATILEDAPFGYWRFGEADGAADAESLGTNADESATYEGGVELGVPGLTGKDDDTAVRFDGIDGKVAIADSGFSNAGGPYRQKSIELWFNADDVSLDYEQILYEQGGSTRGMAIYIREGQLYAGAHNSNNDGPGSPWGGGTLGDGENLLSFVSTEIKSETTYHVALVMDGDDDGTEGTIRGYLDGQLFGEAGNVGLLYAHTDDIAVGGLGPGQAHFDPDSLNIFGNNGIDPPPFFAGVIDELALYNTALSGGQVFIHSGGEFSGDFNEDGAVDLADFQILAGNFGNAGEFADGDLNFNGEINMTDFLAWRDIFQSQPAGAAAAVPEPAAGTLFIVLILALPILRRRRS